MRVAFDSRPVTDPRGVGRYSRCLLRALARDGRGRRTDHRDPSAAPRRRVSRAVDGRRDAAQPLPDGRHASRPRRAQAPQRASSHRRAPATAPAGGAARRARDRAHAGARAGRLRPSRARARARGRRPRGARHDDVPAPIRRGRRRARALLPCPSAICCGSAASSIPIRASTSPSSRRLRASCRSCWSARPGRGRTSSPT